MIRLDNNICCFYEDILELVISDFNILSSKYHSYAFNLLSFLILVAKPSNFSRDFLECFQQIPI
jgi:hypothetical protein